ncbi:MAG: ABC transporter permease [Cyclobacteriaceae bacterium]|nr:ABC transporter permease [Cyclobacteriaceae bacterium]
MLKNYLTTALRSLLRNKLTSFINIAGLALAMTSALTIYLFVADELRYDRHHAKADRIYRVTRNFLDNSGVPRLHLSAVAPPIGPLLKNDYGEIEEMARTLQFSLVMAIEENGERKKMATENDVFMAEPGLFRIFDIPVISGNPATDLERPLTVMLSQSAAKKYFNSEDVIGKHLKGGRQLDLEVTGVYPDFPPQSHWHPDFLISFSTLYDSTIYGRKGLERNWGNNAFSTYLLLDEGTDPGKLEAAFPGFLDKHFGPFAIANFGAPPTFVASRVTTLFLQKVTDIHLKSHLDDELEVGGNINNVYMMAIIGAFIVLIACFNFVNLSTARAARRSKEVGLRKVVGAFRRQLVTQYLGESALTSLLALLLCIPMSLTALQWLNSFTGKNIVLDVNSGLPILVGMVLFSLLVGLLAGIYPAFIISSYKPVQALKGKIQASRGNTGLRKVLVVTQFAISIVLIIATLIIGQQLNYLNTRDLGFDKERVVTLPYYGELGDSYDAFYNELTKSSAIKNLSRSSRLPTGRLLDSQGSPSIMKGDSLTATGVVLKMVVVDHEFFDTYGIAMAAGRPFSKAIPTDDSLAFIINETAARKIGLEVSEASINQDFLYGGVRGKLIGIVRDFHFESLHQEITPMSFFVNPNFYNNLTVKIAGNDLQAGLEHLEKTWRSFLPIRPFDYQFTSDRYERLYESEKKEGQLYSIFSGLAIFIACLGLFGLATFSTLQRIKEIGIRKVLGASVPGILGLLSREIIILVLVANLLAWPAAWYLMNLWFDSFAFHVTISPLTFLLAAVAAVGVALLTVSTQTVRAALSNPSHTLRYE